MRILEYHEGCNVHPVGCMGPRGNFYTLFGSELRHLSAHIYGSIFLGILLFGALYFLRRKGKIKIPVYLAVIISAVVSVLTFFVLAYFFRVMVYY